MAKIGLIATVNNSGLGQMAKQLHKMFDVYMHLVIPHPDKGTHLDAVRGDYLIADKWDASDDSTFAKFVASKPDFVIFFEYPYNWKFVGKLKAAGIKVVWIPMIDSVGTPWLRNEGVIDLIDLFIAPTEFCHNVLTAENLPSVHLPWPINTTYFQFKQRGLEKEVVFLHNIGGGGDGNRKGWDVVLKAWNHMDRTGSRLIVHSQKKINGNLLANVDYRYGNFAEAADLYAEGDVYLSPSRKEGLGLPFREAMSCGLPVIGTDIPPLNEVLVDREFLVKTSGSRPIGPVQNGLVYEPHFADLIDKMMFAKVCGNLDARSRQARDRIMEHSSCTTLIPTYEAVFEELSK